MKTPQGMLRVLHHLAAGRTLHRTRYGYRADGMLVAPQRRFVDALVAQRMIVWERCDGYDEALITDRGRAAIVAAGLSPTSAGVLLRLLDKRPWYDGFTGRQFTTASEAVTAMRERGLIGGGCRLTFEGERVARLIAE
ncbi:MAG TPA: hypothetical protein VNT52_00835 [Acidimicrobiales bacterium]|nr:hypothetical protein [Acidimicrobiales bacterium]